MEGEELLLVCFELKEVLGWVDMVHLLTQTNTFHVTLQTRLATAVVFPLAWDW